MNRYLGAKTKILPHIAKAMAESGFPSGRVCDIFAGSLAVSLDLKRRGYSVIANDINPLSYAYAQAYLLPNDVPQFDVGRLLPDLSSSELAKLRGDAKVLLSRRQGDFLAANKYAEFRSWDDFTERHESLALILAFLQTGDRKSHRRLQLRQDVFTHYSKAGSKSTYVSVRGTRGKRNFFSPENALRIDFILSHIRYWTNCELLDPQEKHTLISVLLDGMERCVNSQGTYHDFPRKYLESRAKKPFRLALPNYFGLLCHKEKHFAANEDSTSYITGAPEHDILYLDPPYNFRQYTAYYHLPNFFARYADIADLNSYLRGLRFVRGQNMQDDFSSTFSNREKFIPALSKLINSAKCNTVILSYYDGANHWNKFLSKDNSIGFAGVSEFFKSSLFEEGSLKIVPINRTNYQSQRGHKAKEIKEYLFIARKRIQLDQRGPANVRTRRLSKSLP